MSGKINLVTGGAKSGKSNFAEQQVSESGASTVVYVATQGSDFQDTESKRAIQKHRAHRPENWGTIEAYLELDKVIQADTGHPDIYLIDCLTLWLTNNLFYLLGQTTTDDQSLDERIESLSSADLDHIERHLVGELDRLIETMAHSTATFWIVTNEIGCGIVPDNKLSRIFRNYLGMVNQKMATRADTVYAVISGIPLQIKGQ